MAQGALAGKRCLRYRDSHHLGLLEAVVRTYVIKDLMINVMGGLDELTTCGACTSDSSGPPCSGICPGTRDPMPGLLEGIRLEMNPAVLASLEAELELQLRNVRERRTVLATELSPQSSEEVAQVREQLTKALAALDDSSASGS